MVSPFSDEVNRTIREFTAMGYEYIGVDGKNHPRLRWTDGTEVSIAGTTKNWNTVANDRARLRRVAGVKSDSPNAAKYKKGLSKKRPPVSHLASEAEALRSAEVDRKLRECVRIGRRLRDIQHGAVGGRERSEAVALVFTLSRLQDELRELGVAPPPPPIRGGF